VKEFDEATKGKYGKLPEHVKPQPRGRPKAKGKKKSAPRKKRGASR